MFISYSYIIGILFYIVSLQGHWILESRSIDVDPATWVNDYELYPLNDQTPRQGAERAIMVSVYYAFTSMSTVGFGDFYPHSDFERIICVFMFLGASIVFSLTLNDFSEVLEQYDSLKAEINESGKLIEFFAVLKHFNANRELSQEMKTKYERYFAYRWSHDRNAGIDDEGEKALLKELPIETQVNLITYTLHRVFMCEFRLFFNLP